MPSYAIEIQAAFENVESLQAKNDIIWNFDVESDSSEIREGITVDPTDELELDGSRGIANFVMKWSKSDSHQAYIKIIELKKINAGKKKGKKESFLLDGIYRSQDEEWVPILCIECRGLRPININLSNNDFIIQTTGGTTFSDGEFTDDRDGMEWADYDEENDASVMVTKLKARVIEVS
jgi:hypothetical protein